MVYLIQFALTFSYPYARYTQGFIRLITLSSELTFFNRQSVDLSVTAFLLFVGVGYPLIEDRQRQLFLLRVSDIINSYFKLSS